MKQKAFTLIELLIVIAIIGILATLAIISLQQARSNARDAKRVADIKQMQTALELYFHDNGRYPSSLTSGTPLISDSNNVVLMNEVPLAPAVRDGDCSLNDYLYLTDTSGASYQLIFCTGKQVSDLPSGNLCAQPGGISPCAGMENITNTVFVDAVNGDDATGVKGDLSLAFQTITAALDNVTDGDSVYVRAGSYIENRILRPNISYHFEDGAIVDSTERLLLFPVDYVVPSGYTIDITGQAVFKAPFRVFEPPRNIECVINIEAKEINMTNDTVYAAIAANSAATDTARREIDINVSGDITAGHVPIVAGGVNTHLNVKADNIIVRNAHLDYSDFIHYGSTASEELANTLYVEANEFIWLNDFASQAFHIENSTRFDTITIKGTFNDTRANPFGARIRGGHVTWEGDFNSGIVFDYNGPNSWTQIGNIASPVRAMYLRNDSVVNVTGNVSGNFSHVIRNVGSNSTVNVEGNITNLYENAGETNVYGIYNENALFNLSLTNSNIVSQNESIYSTEPISVNTYGTFNYSVAPNSNVTLINN